MLVVPYSVRLAMDYVVIVLLVIIIIIIIIIHLPYFTAV